MAHLLRRGAVVTAGDSSAPQRDNWWGVGVASRKMGSQQLVGVGVASRKMGSQHSRTPAGQLVGVGVASRKMGSQHPRTPQPVRSYSTP